VHAATGTRLKLLDKASTPQESTTLYIGGIEIHKFGHYAPETLVYVLWGAVPSLSEVSDCQEGA
jgi:hypothetical protein